MDKLFKAEVFLDRPGSSTVSVWTGEAIIHDDSVRKRFTTQTLGAMAARYADDHGLTTAPMGEDWSKVEMTGEAGARAATLRLVLVPIQEKDGWVGQPTYDGLWWYVGLGQGDEEIMGMALIELNKADPVQAVLGSGGTFKFGHKDFIGPWKKAVVPQPAGWAVENEHSPKTENPCQLPSTNS